MQQQSATDADPDHSDTDQSLQNLAFLYHTQGDQSKYAEAESLYLQSLAIREKVLGPELPQTAKSLHCLALLYQAQGRYVDAEQLYLRVLTLREHLFGREYPRTLVILNNLALCHNTMKK